MKNESVKRCAVVIMTFVMLMSLVAPIRFWAMGYDPINMDLNDPNDPIQDTCWIQRDQTAYIFNTMRPIIADTQKYVYTDPSYKEQYLLTGTEYPVAPEAEITLWVKFVQVLWNGDTQSKYYYVIVHGPPSSDVVYMESLAGEEIHPMYGDGTFADPYKATIYVSVSKTDIARNDIVRSSTSGVGYIFTSGDFQYFTESVELEIGDNHVYIVILNSDGYIAICYDITVIRRPVKYLLTYYANSGTSANKEVEVFKDERYEVAGNSFTPPTGYAFSGWNTAADGNGDDYAPGEEITINSNLELYAQWTPIVPSAPIVSMEKADSVLYLLWHNVGAGGVDSYKVKYYETADITTAVERVIPLSALTINNSEISYHMFSGLKNDVEYTFEVQAVVTATGATSEETITVGTPEYMGDPGGYSTDLVSIQGVSITPPIGGWPEEHGNTLTDPYEFTLSLPHDFSNIIIHRNFIQVADGASFVMYFDYGYTTIIESVNRFGESISWLNTVYIYLKVTSANMLSVKYYRITIS